MTIRNKFVERFGEDEALAIEYAAESHEEPDPAERTTGDERFQYALLTAIGFECLEHYSEAHGIETPTEELKAWIVENADLAGYAGAIPDYLSLDAGAYDEWMNLDGEE